MRKTSLTTLITALGLWAVVCGGSLAAESEAADVRFGDFSWMHGVNYTPSYAATDVQTWLEYDPDVIDRGHQGGGPYWTGVNLLGSHIKKVT